MIPWKVNQISLKTIFKEPIFTAVKGKNPVCDATNISVHVHLSEHTTAPFELPQPPAAAMLKYPDNRGFSWHAKNGEKRKTSEEIVSK